MKRWLISSGEHDRTTRIDAFDHAELERRLVRIAPPRWWHWREDTIDPGVFSAVVGCNEYDLPDRFEAGDLVLDIGAHVGSFAYAAWSRGSRRIRCYEPSPANARLLDLNAEQMYGVRVHAEAVGEGELYFHARDEWNTGAGRCTEEPSDVPVRVVSLDAAIARAGDRVAFLKIDVEGGAEFDIIARCTRLDRVDQLAIEWHDRDPSPLVQTIEAAGFSVSVDREDAARGHLFARRIPGR